MTDKKDTVTPIGPHIAIHKSDDGHECIVGYEGVREGEDMRGKNIWRRQKDGSYEQLFGAPMHGPAQVSTAEYKRGWDKTFGKVNSTGGSA